MARAASIHRSIIVNLSAVESVVRDVLGRAEIHLKCHDDVLPVSRVASTFKRMCAGPCAG